MLFVKANSYQKWLKNLFTMTAVFLSNSNSRFAELLNIRSSISYTLYFQFIFLWHGQYFLRSDILLLLLLTENQWVKEFQIEVKSDLRKKMLSSHSRLWQPGVHNGQIKLYFFFHSVFAIIRRISKLVYFIIRFNIRKALILGNQLV